MDEPVLTSGFPPARIDRLPPVATDYVPLAPVVAGCRRLQPGARVWNVCGPIAG
jgi:hypothetical protein